MIYNGIGYGSHDAQPYAIIGTVSQHKTCDNRDCDNRSAGFSGYMAIKTTQEEARQIFKRLAALDLAQADLASALDLEPNKISKVKSGERQFKANEVLRANAWLDGIEAMEGALPDIIAEPTARSYMAVDVLPSYAGMGGGGTGEGEVEQALLPRRLIEDELHATPSDLLLIEARGTSMEPDFQHGDQILIDKRDRNPVQPGAFALWDGDGYVVKFVERIPRERGRYRVFSADQRLSSFEVDEDEITIMGRPVWFGRRL